MAGSEPHSGLAWYLGIPGSGKTSAALAHAARDARAAAWPVVCLDTRGVAELAGIPQEQTIAGVIERAWQRREHVRLVPRSSEDVDRVAAACGAGGRVCLLVDEAATWLDAWNRSSELLSLMRARRHPQVRMYLTAQHVSADVPQAAFSCAPELFVFRCAAPAVLKRLAADFGLDPELVKALPQYGFLRLRTGF